MRRITSFKLRKFWRITCVMLWCSPASEAQKLHSTSTISARRELQENFNRGFGYQFRPTMAETFLSRRNDQAEQSSWQGEMTLDTSWDLYICVFLQEKEALAQKCWVPKQTSKLIIFNVGSFILGSNLEPRHDLRYLCNINLYNSIHPNKTTP